MTDARQFNVRDSAGRLLCPACGFPEFSGEPAYDERGGLGGVAICPCCFWEPGFDDNMHASAAATDSVLASLRVYRSSWDGKPQWHGRAAKRPEYWDGEQQLARLFEVAPNVR